MLHPFVSAGPPARRSTRSLLFSGTLHLALLGLVLQQRTALHGAAPQALGESVRVVRLDYARKPRPHGFDGHRSARRSAFTAVSGPPAPIRASFDLPDAGSFSVIDPSAIIDSLMAQVARAGAGEILASLENASPIGEMPLAVRDGATSDTGAVALPMNPKPVYPPSMVSRAQEATFTVYFVVDTAGRVDMSTISVPSVVPGEFAASVRQVLTKWVFHPAIHRGMHVRQEVLQPFSFRMRP